MKHSEKLIESIKYYKTRRHPVYVQAYKLKGREFVEKLGVKTAKILKAYDSIDEVNLNELPDSFVTKPTWGCGCKGVFPLVKENGLYRNLFNGELVTFEKVISEFKKTRHSPKLSIEELLSNPLPYDWKVYTFNGKVGVIRQFDRNLQSTITKSWDSKWNNINSKTIFGISKYEYGNNLPPPNNPNELLRVASLLSKSIKYPFVRVDLYEVGKEVYFGEFTTHPATIKLFTDDIDEYLGKLWEEAERELNEQKDYCSNTL
jgi:hypothetical protein